MRQIILVGLGGLLGALARFRLGAWVLSLSSGWSFPLSTFLVNIGGCFVAGILAGVLENQNFSTTELRLFLFTGVLGGFTTFSAFSLETLSLMRRGETAVAMANIFLSVSVALLAMWIGLKLGSLR